MQLPFTAEQFYDVFRRYNEALWPAPVFLTGLAVAAIPLLFVARRQSGRALSAVLAFLWAWLGVAYHLAFFTSINPQAYTFSAVSLIGAAVFLWQGVVRRRLVFRWQSGARGAAGAALLGFALLVYPAWSWLAGHRYPATPTFGLPCPTTLFTLGLLAFLVSPYPRSVLVVPLLWCLVGASAAWLLGVPQDLGLVAAGLVGVVLLARAGTSSASGGATA
jgi:hypothetical protein